jgi:transposase
MPPRASKRILSGKSMPVINFDTAGIDIGATELYVAVPSERSDKPIRIFSPFTEDLLALAQWLKDCRIRSVAMESTGVYWIPVFQILEDQGFEVCLVNARHVKNVPGRKTDVSDCQWLQYLHSVGLLRGSFRPAQQVCAVRSLVRHRDSLMKLASVHIQHMQKALTQMNLQIHHVISDITGVTGLAIIDAILAGERDPEKLAAFRDGRIKANKDTIIKSLVGDYRPEHLFTLRQSLKAFRHYEQMVAECALEIKTMLKDFDSQEPLQPLDATLTHSSVKKTDPFQLREELYRITGVDLTAVPGLQATAVFTILAEIGSDMSKFPTAKHFASWLGLCPDNRISGGKILSVKTRAVANRAATALRMAAVTLWRSKSELGEFFRRMRAKLGAPKAITATAHKLARIIFYLLKNRVPFDQTHFAQQEQYYKQRYENKLRNQAKAFGFALVPLIN